MGFFESCVENFESMDESTKKICDSVWKDVSFSTQDQKLTSSGIFDPVKRQQILTDLQQRPSFLAHVAKKLAILGIQMKTFAEVGTAQGLQSLIFAKSFPDATVFTCDVKDVRDKNFHEITNARFVLGNSQVLSKEVKSNKKTIDFCWIDGAHDSHDVIDDFLSLLPQTEKHTVWAFDDYDSRFGCFRDLNVLIKHFEEHIILDLGLTASGNPNRIVLARGFQ